MLSTWVLELCYTSNKEMVKVTITRGGAELFVIL